MAWACYRNVNECNLVLDLDLVCLKLIVRQRNSIFLKKRAIASIENVFVYSDRYRHSDLKFH